MTTETVPHTKPYYEVPESWNEHAKQYDDAVGRSSRLGARHLISLAEPLLPLLSAPDARAIDLGCGTGSLTFELAKKYPRLPIHAIDISSGMIDQLLASPSATPKITAEVADMRTPVSDSAAEGSFSHVFSTMAIQAIKDPVGEGALAQWVNLLKPDGVVAIAVWDFNEASGPQKLWDEAATAVDPSYVSPPIMPPGYWLGLSELEEGLKAAGFRDVKARTQMIGFHVGKEGFMKFFWESGNGMAVERQQSFRGDLERVKVEMERVLDEEYDGGENIPLSVGLAVGRKPKTD